MTLYKIELSGRIPSVQGYVAFTEKTRWSVLREYLLKAISIEWTEKASRDQFGLLTEIKVISAEVAEDKITVISLWKSLSKELNGTVCLAFLTNEKKC